MTNQTTYTVQFWHGGEAVWKDVRPTNLPTLEEAKAFKAAQVQMCGGMVDFCIIEVAA